MPEPHDTFALPLERLPDPLAVPPLAGPAVSTPAGSSPIHATVRPPGSKSLTNRALLLAALAEGTSTLRFPLLEADDARRMVAAVRTLGATVDDADAEAVRVTGVGGRWRPDKPEPTLFLNNAGTATRFLAAAALVAPGPIIIDGNERMRQRPIGELGAMLETLGAGVAYLGEPGCPPVRVTPPLNGTPAVETVEIGRTQSSQFVSALLLTASCLPAGLTVRYTGAVTSASYVRMTAALLESVGVTVKTSDDMRTIRVLPGLRAFDLDVEADASGATYFWAAGALLPAATVGVRGLHARSDQGDAGFPELMARMGASVSETAESDDPDAPRTIAVRGPQALAPVLADMADMPDAAVTLAVACAFAGGTSILRGVRTLRVKETDRIAALKNELAKIGVAVEADAVGDPDVMTVTPPEDGVDCSAAAPEVRFDTYDDHRMAMALSLVGLRRPNVLINEPACVAKTYPTYYRDLARLYPR